MFDLYEVYINDLNHEQTHFLIKSPITSPFPLLTPRQK